MATIKTVIVTLDTAILRPSGGIVTKHSLAAASKSPRQTFRAETLAAIEAQAKAFALAQPVPYQRLNAGEQPVWALRFAVPEGTRKPVGFDDLCARLRHVEPSAVGAAEPR